MSDLHVYKRSWTFFPQKLKNRQKFQIVSQPCRGRSTLLLDFLVLAGLKVQNL